MENENIQVEITPKDYSTLSLVLGILSIVLICCSGFVTVGFGIAAVVLGKKTMKGYPGNQKALAGFICGIIGIALSLTSITMMLIEEFQMLRYVYF